MEINKQRSTVRSSASEAIIDQGLRSYMLKVYNYMASGVLLTGFVALMFFKMAVVTSAEGQIIGLTNFGNTIYASGLKWVIMLAPLAVVFYMSFGIAKMSAAKAQTTFWVFAALMGASLSSILLVSSWAAVLSTPPQRRFSALTASSILPLLRNHLGDSGMTFPANPMSNAGMPAT